MGRVSYLESRRKERLSQFPILQRNRNRKLPAVLSYREQQIKDADNRMRYHAIRIKGLGTTL